VVAPGSADLTTECVTTVTQIGEVLTMATMTNVRNKLERVSALKGWRMRWYMQ
jgi:hypothetical protein